MTLAVAARSAVPVQAAERSRVVIGLVCVIGLVAIAVFVMIESRSKKPPKPLPPVCTTTTKVPVTPEMVKEFLVDPSSYCGLINCPYTDGWCFLHFVAADGSRDDCIKPLIIENYDTNLDAETRDGKTIQDVAKNQSLKDWLADRQKIKFEQLKYRFEHRKVPRGGYTNITIVIGTLNIEKDLTKEMLNWQDEHGCTLLHYAVQVHRTDEEIKQRPPCMRAERCFHGYLVETLVKLFDPNLSLKNNDGKTVADLVVDDRLKAWLNDPDQIQFDRDHDNAMKAIRADDVHRLEEIIQRKVNSQKLLEHAAAYGKYNCYKLLMDQKPETINKRDILELAFMSSSRDDVIKIVTDLLEDDQLVGELNCPHKDGGTILDWLWEFLSIDYSAYWDHLFEVEQLLVDKGAKNFTSPLQGGCEELRNKFLKIISAKDKDIL